MKKFLGVSFLTLVVSSLALAEENSNVACGATSDRTVAGVVDSTPASAPAPAAPAQNSGAADTQTKHNE